MKRLVLSTLVLLALSLGACRPATSSTIVKAGVSVTPGGPTATPECLVWVPQRGSTMKCALTATPGPSRTPPPVPCGEIIVCKCVSPILVEAWVDHNANANRDPEDTPLQGVRFRLQWIEERKTCATPYMESYSLETDATGHDFYEVGGCGCGSERIELEMPAGYKLGAFAYSECLFDPPESYGNHSMRNIKCRRYGFTPAAP